MEDQRRLSLNTRANISSRYALVTMLLVLFLAGCSATTSVTILSDDEWEAESEVVLPPQMVEQMGGFEQVRQNMEMEVDGEMENMRIEETSGGGIRMIGNSSGQGGFDSLNEKVFSNQATINRNEQGQITIDAPYNPEGMSSGGVFSMIVKISGREIIDSNADRVSGSTAIWTNPERMRVTLIPGRPLVEEDSTAPDGGAAAPDGGAAAQSEVEVATAQAVAAVEVATAQAMQAAAVTAQAQAEETTAQAKFMVTGFAVSGLVFMLVFVGIVFFLRPRR